MQELEKVFLTACTCGDVGTVLACLASGVNPAASNNSGICWAADYGHIEIVRTLLADPRVNPCNRNSYAIRWACHNGHADVVRLLLADSRVDPCVENNEPIIRAAYQGRLNVVKILLADPRVDPSGAGNSAVRWAAETAHLDVMMMLLTDPRVDPSVAIQYAHRFCARALLLDSRFGIDVNRTLFERYHPRLVFRYDDMISQCMTMGWLAKQVITWSDIVQPMSDRIKAGWVSLSN